MLFARKLIQELAINSDSFGTLIIYIPGCPSLWGYRCVWTNEKAPCVPRWTNGSAAASKFTTLAADVNIHTILLRLILTRPDKQAFGLISTVIVASACYRKA